MATPRLQVQKRGGRGYEPVSFDKITRRLELLCDGLGGVDPARVAQATVAGIYNRIRTEEIDVNSARIAESMKLDHPDYSVLASRILVSNLHKNTPPKFSACIKHIQDTTSVFDDTHVQYIMDNAAELDSMIDHSADYNYDYFGFRTLENAYLRKVPVFQLGPDGLAQFADKYGKIYNFGDILAGRRGYYVVEGDKRKPVTPIITDVVFDRPQYLYMRVAVAVNIGDIGRIRQCYASMRDQLYTHATPTLFNACNVRQQLNSCFLLGTGDSIEAITKSNSDCALISKSAGGIGMWQHPIRPAGSLIRSTRGKSGGLPKQLRVTNNNATTWDQGGGKRNGAIAIYVEPWHGDIQAFLQLKLQNGEESARARDLFYAMWVPDLFVKRVLSGAEWSLFSEDTAPGLSDVYDGMHVCKKCGRCADHNLSKYVQEYTSEECAKLTSAEFDRRIKIGDKRPVAPAPADTDCEHVYERRNVFTELYEYYESIGLATEVLSARSIVNMMCTAQRETGIPYVCFKDHVNRMSNQSNIGTVKSSNLCTEIMEYSSETSYASCTLASINLPKFVHNGKFDYAKLHRVVREIIPSLDLVIDRTVFPVPECVQNARDYRPVAVGIQGAADMYAMLRIPFASDAAGDIDLRVAETIYHAALTASCERAEKVGPYAAFAGSPASKGVLHHDMWMENNEYFGGILAGINPTTGMYDWDALRARIVKHGLRNSLLVANMPTVSTSQIFGNNESFEPFPNNAYTKSTLAGKFTVTNNHMIRHLLELGLWDRETSLAIENNAGSIQGIKKIPPEVREIYKTVWEIPQAALMRRAALRGAFVDQAQSLNIRLQQNTNAYLRGVFIKGWQLGLKTGSYYIRTKPAASAMKTTIAETAKLAGNTAGHEPTDKINVTVERVSSSGVVKSRNEHTFALLQQILEGDDSVGGLLSDVDENIVPVQAVITPQMAAEAVSRYQRQQRLTEKFTISDEGCLACGS